MITLVSRIYTYLLAVLYTVLGLLLFSLPARLAPSFAWKVSSFVTMTIGAWCLGTAWFAWASALRRSWSLTYPGLLYLWLFGLLELGVVIAFREKLQLAHPIAWLYLITVALNVLAALVGLLDWLISRPSITPTGQAAGRDLRILAGIVVLFVMLLGINGFTIRMGGFGTNGEIFPEVISAFTLRGFAGLYLALGLSGIPLVLNRGSAAYLQHILANLGLILGIPIAALANFSAFDFSAHPLGAFYIGAYLLVGLVEAAVFLRYRQSYQLLKAAA
jgi:hypothetical protein